MRPIVRATRLAGLCGLLTALVLLPAAAEADGLPDFFKDSDTGQGPGLGASVLEQERGSGLHSEPPAVAAKPSTTAVILWDEWQRRTAGGSTVGGPGVTVRAGPQILYHTGYLHD